MSKQLYLKLFSVVNKIKWFQVLLCITSNSIKRQSYTNKELNGKTIIFQTIQFTIITQFKWQNSFISNNSVKHKHTV